MLGFDCKRSKDVNLELNSSVRTQSFCCRLFRNNVTFVEILSLYYKTSFSLSLAPTQSRTSNGTGYLMSSLTELLLYIPVCIGEFSTFSE